MCEIHESGKMTGDIQEPLRLSFQADYLHSGSISFGRFETEALCWERRSSFSHNRYLEEVERCSKPGSVTEKKAYFEAHFRRKKALLSQNSLECQSASDCSSRENGNLQNMYQEDIGNLNEDSCITSYDESPGRSVHDPSEMTQYGLDYSGYVEPEIEHTIDNFSSEQNLFHETGNGNLPQSDREQKNEAKQDLNGDGEAVTSEKLSNSRNCSPGSPANDMGDCLNYIPASSSEVKIGSHVELESSKLRTPQNSVVKAKKSISSEASKGFRTKPANREFHTSSRSRKEKQISDSTASTIRSVPRTLKTVASQASKTKPLENKSSCLQKESTKNITSSQPSTTERVAPRAQQNANRHIRAVNSIKPITRQSCSAFSFRSDECPEKRKEFNVKSEEKILAKKTEVPQVKAKKQEKTEADVKQLRKSLNFKATPMPTFYTEAGHSFDKSKVVASDYKISKVHNKPSSPGVGSAKRSLSCQSVGSREAFLTMKSMKNNSEETSYPSAFSSVSNANLTELEGAESDSHSTPAVLGRALAAKGEREKIKDASLRNHRVLDSNQLNKGQKIEGKHKEPAERRKKGEMKKAIKGVGLSNSSRMGSAAVGIAS